LGRRLKGQELRHVLGPDDLSLSLNVYLGNGLTIEEIEDVWLSALDLPRSCLRKHQIDHFPTSSSGKKKTLPLGVCRSRSGSDKRALSLLPVFTPDDRGAHAIGSSRQRAPTISLRRPR
jgi:hypothetical protein